MVESRRPTATSDFSTDLDGLRTAQYSTAQHGQQISTGRAISGRAATHLNRTQSTSCVISISLHCVRDSVEFSTCQTHAVSDHSSQCTSKGHSSM